MNELKSWIKYDGTNWREIIKYIENFCKYGSDEYYLYLDRIKKYMEIDDCVMFYDDDMHVVCEEEAYIMFEGSE